jgi:uncharacterized protein with FMN-binding domain
VRRITWWLLSTVAGVVLLFSYRTSTGSGALPPAIGGQSTVDGQTVTSGQGGTGPTYKGSVAQTRWGPVQVTITVGNGKITNVSVPTYPNGNGQDREINAYALPILQQETLSAQSANIDTVSGATVTSNGYKRSLQAAIDAAHLS